MNILRKALACFMLGLSFAVPMAAVPEAQANPPAHAHHHIYEVYYRTCPHSRWIDYGGYYRQSDANRAANWFRNNGYEAFVRAR